MEVGGVVTHPALIPRSPFLGLIEIELCLAYSGVLWAMLSQESISYIQRYAANAQDDDTPNPHSNAIHAIHLKLQPLMSF